MHESGLHNVSSRRLPQRLEGQVHLAVIALACLVVLVGRVRHGVGLPAGALALGGLIVAVWIGLAWIRSRRPWTRPGLSNLLFVALLTATLVPGDLVPRRTSAEETAAPTEVVIAQRIQIVPLSLGTPIPDPTAISVATTADSSTEAATAQPDPPTDMIIEPTATASPIQDPSATNASPDTATGQPAPAVTEGASTAIPAPLDGLELMPATAAPTISPETNAPPAIGHGKVANADGDDVRLRSGPSYDAFVLRLVPEGTEVRVLAGPLTAADDSQWWQVTAFDVTGYMVEDFLALSLDAGVESDATATAASATPTSTGEPAFVPTGPGLGIVANADGDDVRLRSEPGYDAPVLQMVPEGTAIQVLDGPTIVVDGSRWWQVIALDITGYMVEDFLVVASDPTVVPDADAIATPNLATAEHTPVATEPAVTDQASNPDPILVEAIAPNTAVVPGQTASFHYRVTNSATVDVMVQLSVRNSLEGWDAHIGATVGGKDTVSPVLIPASGEIIVTVDVTVPAEARVQQQNRTTLSATALPDAFTIE
jgi:uncharacterized protein YgiM (DUF1202 family)